MEWWSDGVVRRGLERLSALMGADSGGWSEELVFEVLQELGGFAVGGGLFGDDLQGAVEPESGGFHITRGAGSLEVLMRDGKEGAGVGECWSAFRPGIGGRIPCPGPTGPVP